MTIAKILKSIQAHDMNAPYWFDVHEEYPNWNDETLFLMDCEEIWALDMTRIWNKEDMAHTTELWFFRKHINRWCDKPENIWHMQIGVEETEDYSQIFSSEKEAIDAINNNKIVWSKGDPTWDI